jgi:hypothetical protein
MTIFENKKLERDTYRKLRDGISLNQRENVEKNVRIYVDSLGLRMRFSLVHAIKSRPAEPLV